MTSAHWIYIPGMILLGLVIGYVLGGRRAELAREDEADKDRRRAAREARARARERE